MSFPRDRPRRLRRTEALRRMVRETDVLPRHLIQPLFVEEGEGVRRPIPTMPGQIRYSVDTVGEAAAECEALGIPCVLLFGIPSHKDATGTAAWDDDGVVQRAVRAVREAAPSLAIACDLCLCEYTDHGHCGVLNHGGGVLNHEGGILDHGAVQNDPTLDLYVKTALSYARAGADVVAPSGMMDGAVGAIRDALEGAGHHDTAILAYAVKYASAFYGPFRDAVESAPREGDRRGYQMDPANVREGLLEAALDDEEGADMLMVKPAGPYLDVIAHVRASTDRPLVAYQVSGEYALLKSGAEQGLVDGRRAMWESVRAIRRAGADIVVTYFAKDLAREHRDHGTT